MSSENTFQYKVRHIDDIGHLGKIEVRTLGNYSNICLDPELIEIFFNVWLDIFCIFENKFSLRVTGFQTVPGRLQGKKIMVVVIFHEPLQPKALAFTGGDRIVGRHYPLCQD